MPEYKVRLESQTDSQWREMNVAAGSEKLAMAMAMQRELKLVNFSLIPPALIEPVEPDGNDVNILVQYLEARNSYDANLGAHTDAVEQAEAALAKLEKTHSIDKSGRAVGPTRRGRGHLHAHRQTEPYKIVSVEEVEPDVERLVHAVLALQDNPAAWDRTLKMLRDGGVPLNVVTASLFGLQTQKQLDGSAVVVWSSATLKVALTTSAWTPNQDTHDFFDDVTNELPTAGGYTAGGATLASKTSTYDTATDQIRLDAADTSWTSSTITARRAPLYNDTAGAASTDPVLGWVDFGADFSTTAGTFQITWDATGIIVHDVT